MLLSDTTFKTAKKWTTSGRMPSIIFQIIPKGYRNLPQANFTLRQQYFIFLKEIFHCPIRENFTVGCGKKFPQPALRCVAFYFEACSRASHHASGTFSPPVPLPREMVGLLAPWKSLPPLGSRPYSSVSASASAVCSGENRG